MSVDESGWGSADGVPARRWKILGILRDALRTRSVGIIEELPEKGNRQVRQAGRVIAGLLPVTNPLVDGMVQHVHQCAQVQGRDHLFAASAEQEDRARDHPSASRRAEPARRSRRSDSVPADAEHSAGPGT